MAKVTDPNNTALALVEFIAVDYGGDRLKAFKGEGVRSTSLAVELKCLYQKNITDKVREKYGLSQQVTAMVYVSPLELEQKTGSQQFPDYTNGGYSRMSVSFLGAHYEIDSIVPLESVFNGKEYTCVAYQMNLVNSAGTTSYQ